MIGIYIFINLVNFWLKRRQWDSPVCFCIQSAVISHVRSPWKTPLHTHERKKAQKSNITFMY